MPLKNQHPYEWPPLGLTDAEDTTHAFRGAMTMLQDLIPAPNTAATWICRPGAQQISGVGKSVCFLTVGNILYGMRHSATFAGKDEPFAFNLSTLTYLPISGMTAGNLPTSQPDTGDWTPPTAAQVGSRVVFTHPGFAGGTTNAPYFETALANVYNGSTLMDGIAPQIFALLQAGMSVIGTDIQLGTVISAVSLPVVSTTGTGTSGMPTVTVASATGIVKGQVASAPGIPSSPPTTVTNVVGTTITLSANLTANLAAAIVTFTGSVLQLSLAPTNNHSQETVWFVSNTSQKIGWLDMSSFSTTVQVNTNNTLDVLSGNANIQGINPGMTVTGPGIPAGTTIQQTDAIALVVPNVTVSNTTGLLSAAAIPSQGSVTVGMAVLSALVPMGAIVNQLIDPMTWTMNATAFSNSTGAITFVGSAIFISAPATATATFVNVTITGGTPTNPQWGSGDVNVTPLAGVPVFVRQFSGRAYYGVNTTNPVSSAVQMSDPGIACQTTSPTQVITFNDGVPVTAAAGLPLDNQLGGIIQSLMVFQGAANVRQITGDPVFNNLAQNSLQTATGTLSPNSIATTPLGLLFASPDGLRLIDFNARISDPIGLRGEGIVKPFINAVTPTRAAAAYNANVYRISITWQPQSGATFGAAQRNEFWFHLDLKKWSGPHSFTSDLLAPWQSLGSFVASDTSGLWQSDPAQTPTSLFVEKGQLMTWAWTTGLLPDNPEQMATAVNESSIFFSMPSNDQALATATDDQGAVIGQAYVWVGPIATISQSPIYWNKSLAFRQMTVSLAGKASGQVRLGTLNLRYQRLGYQLPRAPASPFIVGSSILGGPDVLAPSP